MNWKKRFSTIIPKVGMKLKLRADSDKSDWGLSNMAERYKKIYTIKSANSRYDDGFYGNIGITLGEEDPYSTWSMNEEFLNTHFYQV